MKVEFREEKIGFTIIFYRKNFENMQNDPVNVPVNVHLKLNKTENQILQLIKNNPNITQKEIANILKLSEKTIKRNTNKLKEKGLLKRIGADKNGYLKIIQK